MLVLFELLSTTALLDLLVGFERRACLRALLL